MCSDFTSNKTLYTNKEDDMMIWHIIDHLIGSWAYEL